MITSILFPLLIDWLLYHLIIRKFEGLSRNIFKLLFHYLKTRKQLARIGSSYSFWSGLLLFHILINDVFIDLIFMLIENCEICNISDNNTLYICGIGFMTHGKKWYNKIIKLKISPIVINEIGKVELFGIAINCTLTFNENLHILGFNANYKLYTLRRTRQSFCAVHLLIVFFSYAKIIWVLCRKNQVYHSLHHCWIQPEVLCDKFCLLVLPTKHQIIVA